MLRHRRPLAVALAVVLGAAGVVAASGGAARVDAPAVRQFVPAGDTAVVFDVDSVDAFVVEASFAVAGAVGAGVATGRTASVGMRRLLRGGVDVHSAPDGYLIPIVVLALPEAAIGGLFGPELSTAVGDDSVAMNRMTADLMGAAVGDLVELQTAAGGAFAVRVATIRPYAEIGGAELVISTEAADRLGLTADTRTVLWNIESRPAFEAAVRAAGLVGRRDTKVERSWDGRDPDDSISTVRAKVALGEPWYRVLGDGTLEMHPTWKATYLPPERRLLDANIRIRARCHVAVEPALRAALADVAAAGLGHEIDVANTNTYGGCFAARYSRTSGFLSRHTWAMAIDINTVSNCLGCIPRMDCDVVRIFRRHGFAWGGNFRRPDGMHFEWVGEPVDQIAYPSTYCPNLLAARAESVTGAAGVSVATGVATNGIDVLVAGVADPPIDGHASG